MPSKSPEQERLMQAAAHNKAFAKRVGVPQSVAKEFVKTSMAATKALTGQKKAK